jgi:hypothetical protein
MSYLGIVDRPIGVKIQIFDETNCREAGIFIALSEEIWRKAEEVADPDPKKVQMPKHECLEKTSQEVLERAGNRESIPTSDNSIQRRLETDLEQYP